MPTLVVNIGVMPRRLTLNAMEVACTFEDEVRYSSYLGQEVLVVSRIIETAERTAFATGTLSRFASSNTGNIAVLSDLQVMPSEQPVPSFLADSVFALLPDEYSFTQPIESEARLEPAEAGAFFHPLEIYGQIAQQVRLLARSFCAYSGIVVPAGEGSATPIQPASLGGWVHVRNFIYLHDEPARLFNSFAWTVGPDMEIIVDAFAMTTSMLSKINPGGKLLVGDNRDDWPDERALAWHREQFLQRLR